MKERTLVLDTPLVQRLQLKPAIAILLSTCLFPFLVHLFPPYQGIPIGAILLPMFYIPFIAIVFFRLHVGLIAGALAPVLNFLITGNPQWQFVLILSFELIVFVLLASQMLQLNPFKWVAAPLGYLGAKVISSGGLLFVPLLPQVHPLDFLTQSVSNGIPGIIILALINVMVVRYARKS
jgi:hypothetical protein